MSLSKQKLHASTPASSPGVVAGETMQTQTRARVSSRVTGKEWGWLPVLSVLLALGVLLVASAFRAALSGFPWAEFFLWLGLILMIAPVAYRLASPDASRFERIGLVILLTLSLYLVKVMHSPFAYTYADELVHAGNAEMSLFTQRLFGENAILSATPRYPGLTSVTSAMVGLTGLSSFSAGLLVIGAARLVIILALYLLYENLAGSSRLAGIGAVLYMANSNYLYWSAQYSYESLALPLAVFLLFALHLYSSADIRRTRFLLTLGILLLMVAVITTHHLTAFALMIVLLLLATLNSFVELVFRVRRPVIWGFAFTSVILTLLWLVIVAPQTFDYIYPILRDAINTPFQMFFGGGDQVVRAPFESGGIENSPLWERIIGYISVVLIAIGIPFGLLELWRRRRTSGMALVLAQAALVYIPIQLLRLTNVGWETANRSSEFLFVGIALVLAFAVSRYFLSRSSPVRRLFVSALVVLLFVGGIIAGWPPALRLSKPYQVSVPSQDGSSVSIEPQGVAAAHWTREYLGTGNRMAADSSTARFLQAYGLQYALTDARYGIRDLILSGGELGAGEREIVSVTQVRYLVFSLPRISWSEMLGQYYNPGPHLAGTEQSEFDPSLVSRFENEPGVDRLLDTGEIVIYDIGVLNDAEGE